MRAALIVACLLLLAAPASASLAPRLALAGQSPFTVRGAHFRAGERVRVTVQAEQGGTRIVTATATGTFLARFPGVTLGSCPAYTVRAFGNEGSRATLRVMPECPQPISP